MKATLILQDGTELGGVSFGAQNPSAGEVVFSTGMMGYPESLTDPSYKGQILVLTYPIVGNYGVPDKSLWEAGQIMVSGLIVSNYIDTPSHFQSRRTLAQWFKDENIPLVEIKDTRFLTQKIRETGTMLGKITFGKDIAWYDPDKDNLVSQVSISDVTLNRPVRRAKKTILLIDCGAKRNIERALLKRGVNVLTIPWDFDPFNSDNDRRLQKLLGKKTKLFDGILISNGPGDPRFVKKTVNTIKQAMERDLPLLGICLGHQLMALAGGGKTGKLKYGHRSQNQPCTLAGSERCFITTQNHGFSLTDIPAGFSPWFTNANDGSNEGLLHADKPWMSVQFHPEATPGPMDTEWVFDYFLEKI